MCGSPCVQSTMWFTMCAVYQVVSAHIVEVLLPTERCYARTHWSFSSWNLCTCSHITGLPLLNHVARFHISWSNPSGTCACAPTSCFVYLGSWPHFFCSSCGNTGAGNIALTERHRGVPCLPPSGPVALTPYAVSAYYTDLTAFGQAPSPVPLTSLTSLLFCRLHL